MKTIQLDQILVGIRILRLLLLGVCLSAVCRIHAAESAPLSEHQLKALILKASASFFQWPEDAFPTATAPLVLGIMGRDPFGGDFEIILKNRKIKGRSVLIRRSAQLKDLMESHILFISDSETTRLTRILKAIGKRPILTAGDMDEFGARGGILYLRMERGKVVFELNRAAAKQARLNINAQLLQLAKQIHTNAPQVEK